MTAALALTSAVVYGCADFLGGMASRRASAFAVSALSQLLGFGVLLVALLAWPGGAFAWSAIGWGALAGVTGSLGVVALYAALGTGRMSVVAPTTAVLAALIPAAFDVISGTRVGPVGLAGMGVAVAAIAIVTATEEGGHAEESARKAFGLAVLAGACFAGFFIAISHAGDHAGLWPLVGARTVSVPMLLVLAAFRGGMAIPRIAWRATAGAGTLDMVANIAVLLAIQSGPLAVAAVLSSLYPVATVLLARVVLKERLGGLQRIGVVTAIVAVALIAAR